MVFPYADTGGQAQLWLRRWENLTPTPIPGTEGGTRPAISPDGEEVAFIAQNELKVAPLRGGVVRTLTGSAACCPAWGRDGYVYYSPVDRTISRVLATGGGAVEQITARDQEGDGPQGDFQILPGGEVAVFTVWGVPVIVPLTNRGRTRSMGAWPRSGRARQRASRNLLAGKHSKYGCCPCSQSRLLS